MNAPASSPVTFPGVGPLPKPFRPGTPRPERHQVAGGLPARGTGPPRPACHGVAQRRRALSRPLSLQDRSGSQPHPGIHRRRAHPSLLPGQQDPSPLRFAVAGRALEVTSLHPDAFIDRFLTHVLPKGFVRVRHYGWMSGAARKDRLLVRALVCGEIGEPAPSSRRSPSRAVPNAGRCSLRWLASNRFGLNGARLPPHDCPPPIRSFVSTVARRPPSGSFASKLLQSP